LLAYDARRRSLGWLDVFGEETRIGEDRVGKLREKVVGYDFDESGALMPVREIGEDDGLLYIVRDVADGEEI